MLYFTTKFFFNDPATTEIYTLSTRRSSDLDFKITREHGQWIEKAGVWMMAMYHPSALLRDPRKRPESFEDLKSLQAKIREVCVRTY